MSGVTEFQLSPLVPWWLIVTLGSIGIAVIAYGVWRRARGAWLRLGALATALLALANPVLIEETREPINDVAAIVIDESPSQRATNRMDETEKAADALRLKLAALPNLDVRVVRAGKSDGEDAAGADGGTRLFEALERALADVPRERVAGAVLVTDGQVHDVPKAIDAKRLGGPVHGLIIGSRNERDRRIAIEQAPSFGLVGSELQMTLKVEDSGVAANATAMANLSVSVDGGPRRSLPFAIGRSLPLTLKLDHAGPNVVELEVDAAPNELTLQNNRAVIVINGVRDRLRVLLVTGEPHAGERVWRNLLKSDPSVDLIHFTILRPPEKQDGTPIRELSLIAFPVRELFELKLNDFDLIIFDRYRRRGLLPPSYFENISKFVQKGGAFLEASGPAYASSLTIYRTALSDVLPGKPTGRVILEGFKPQVTDLGRRHPVTAGLPGAGEPGEAPSWGRWFRLIDVEASSGQVLMSGKGNRPLLLLERQGKGRVAQIFSDHPWLWARGFEGGGPQAEMLRRVAHWLMKEPDLEEDSLRAESRAGRLEIARRSLEPDTAPVIVTRPDGSTAEIKLEDGKDGRAMASIPAPEPGVYRLSDGKRQALAAVGAVNPKEFSDLAATPRLLQPVADATGGGIRWYSDGLPDARKVAVGRDTRGRDWFGFIAHDDFTVTGVKRIPLLPVALVLLALMGTLLFAWRREGK